MNQLYVADSCGVKRSAKELNCDQCGTKFLKQIKRILRNKTGKHFCSQKCSIIFKKNTNQTIVCAWCNKTVERKLSSLRQSKSGLRFCSLNCKNHAQSLTGILEITPAHYGTGKKNHCKICNTPTDRLLRCPEHRTRYTYSDYIQRWKKGDVSGNTCSDEQVSSHIRRYMFEKYHNQCQKCKWSQINSITGKIPLTINHIDGNCSNSKEDNLELLCPNCHSLTPNYGALNKNNGRKSRRIATQ